MEYAIQRLKGIVRHSWRLKKYSIQFYFTAPGYCGVQSKKEERSGKNYAHATVNENWGYCDKSCKIFPEDWSRIQLNSASSGVKMAEQDIILPETCQKFCE